MHNIIKSLFPQDHEVKLVGKFSNACAYTVETKLGDIEMLVATFTVDAGDEFALTTLNGEACQKGTGFAQFKKALKSQDLLCKFETIEE